MPSVINARALAIAVALFGAMSLTGCYGTTGECAGYDVYGYPASMAATVPTDIYGYPSTPFGGSTAYLVGQRWYTPNAGHWYVLRQEPRELSRYRTYINTPGMRRAPPPPPSYRSPTPGYGYPAPYRAPPAYRP